MTRLLDAKKKNLHIIQSNIVYMGDFTFRVRFKCE